MTVSLNLKITYGAFTVGKGTEDTYRIDKERFGFTREEFGMNLNFNLFVLGDDEDDLQTKCLELEEYRKRRSTLLVEMNDVEIFNLGSSGATSKNSLGDYEHIRDSRRYNKFCREFAVSIFIDLPPLNRTNGRTEIGSTCQYRENRSKLVTIRAKYSATGSTTALANYNNDGDYYNQVLSVYGGTYNKPSELLETPDIGINTDLDVTRTYEEIIFNEKNGTLDDPDLISFKLQVSREISWEGDYFGPLPEKVPGSTAREVYKLVNYVISVSSFVDKDRTTDLKGKWEKSVRPYALSFLRQKFGVQTIATPRDNFVPSKDANYFQASLSVVCAEKGKGQIVNCRISVRVNDSYGVIMVPIGDGQKKSFYPMETKGVTTRMITQTTTVVGINSVLGGDNPPIVSFPGIRDTTGWQVLGREYIDDPYEVGNRPKSEHFKLLNSTIIRQEQYMQKSEGTSLYTLGGVGF